MWPIPCNPLSPWIEWQTESCEKHYLATISFVGGKNSTRIYWKREITRIALNIKTHRSNSTHVPSHHNKDRFVALIHLYSYIIWLGYSSDQQGRARTVTGRCTDALVALTAPGPSILRDAVWTSTSNTQNCVCLSGLVTSGRWWKYWSKRLSKFWNEDVRPK